MKKSNIYLAPLMLWLISLLNPVSPSPVVDSAIEVLSRDGAAVHNAKVYSKGFEPSPLRSLTQKSFISCNNVDSSEDAITREDDIETNGTDSTFTDTNIPHFLNITALSANPRWDLQSCPYYIQYPYDLNKCERYAEKGRLKDFLIFSDDEPFKQGSNTLPRTELRVLDCDMSSGSYRFTAKFHIPCGTTGVTFFQIFDEIGTYLQLRSYDDQITVTRSPITSYTCEEYHSLEVIFHVSSTYKQTIIYIDSQLVYDSSIIGNNGESYYFKCGVYLANRSTPGAEIFFKNIKIFKFM